MPHVIVKLHPGRSEQQKSRLTKEIVKDVIASKLRRRIGFSGY